MYTPEVAGCRVELPVQGEDELEQGGQPEEGAQQPVLMACDTCCEDLRILQVSTKGSTSAQLITMLSRAAGPRKLARENTHLHVLGLVSDHDKDVHALGLPHVRSVLVVVVQVYECNRTSV
jgi:hypothetical protein